MSANSNPTFNFRPRGSFRTSAPKGSETGAFAFGFDGNTEPADAFFAPFGTFTECKKAALAEARNRGARSFTLLD